MEENLNQEKLRQFYDHFGAKQDAQGFTRTQLLMRSCDSVALKARSQSLKLGVGRANSPTDC